MQGVGHDIYEIEIKSCKQDLRVVLGLHSIISLQGDVDRRVEKTGRKDSKLVNRRRQHVSDVEQDVSIPRKNFST